MHRRAGAMMHQWAASGRAGGAFRVWRSGLGCIARESFVFKAKFMLPWSFSEEEATQTHMAQLQHNMRVTGAAAAALSIITGGGRWVNLIIAADPLYQHLLITAERNFWRSVGTGEQPRLFNAEAPRPRIEAVRVVDMTSSNSWAEFAGIFLRTREAHAEHENVKTELKAR